VKKYLSVLSIFLIILFSQCGTSKRVRVLKPAELDVGSVKKVAVLDFEFMGSWDFASDDDTPKTIKHLGRLLLNNMFETKKPPDPYEAYPGRNISDMLVSRLVTNQYYTVIERQELSKVLQEQALSLSGVIDEAQAAEVGKLLGAEGLIMGSGTYSVKDHGKWETYKEKKVEKKRYRITREVNVKITFKIVNVTTGTIVVSKTNSASTGKNRKFSSTGADENEAIKAVPDWRPIVDEMVNRVLSMTMNQIAPHYVTESRKIEEGESDQMEAAVEYVKRDLWDDALEIWQMVVDNSRAEPEDRIAATYNIGLYYELIGQLDMAEEYFDKAFKMSGNDDYLDSKARIKRRRQELERLRQQQQ
jgi:curli biogenesis system outer membrane secretion channel CsgG